jgi:hypothetical protein
MRRTRRSAGASGDPGHGRVGKDESSKKEKHRLDDGETIRPHHDFSGGVRGKYAARYREGTNVVLLDPDVAAAFPDSEAVNKALRALLGAVPARRPKRRSV